MSLIVLVFCEGTILTLVLKVAVFVALDLSAVDKAIIPVLVGALGFSPTVTSKPFVAAVGSVLKLCVCFSVTSFLLRLVWH